MNIHMENFIQGYIIKSLVKNTLSPPSLMWNLVGLAERDTLKIANGYIDYNKLTLNGITYVLMLEPLQPDMMICKYNIQNRSEASNKSSQVLIYEDHDKLFIYSTKDIESCLLLFKDIINIPDIYADIKFSVYQNYFRLTSRNSIELEYKPLRFDHLTRNELFNGSYKYNISIIYMAPITALFSDGTGIYLIWKDHIQKISNFKFDNFLLIGYYLIKDKTFMAYDCYYYAGISYITKDFAKRHEQVYNIVYNLKPSIDQEQFAIYSQSHHTLDRLETLYERVKELSARQTLFPKFGFKLISNGPVSKVLCYLTADYKNMSFVRDVYRISKMSAIPVFNFDPVLLGRYAILERDKLFSALVPYHLNYYNHEEHDDYVNKLRLEDVYGLNNDRFEVYYRDYHLYRLYERLTRTTLGRSKRLLWVAPIINFRPEDEVDIIGYQEHYITTKHRYIDYNTIYIPYDYIIIRTLDYEASISRVKNLLNKGGIVYILTLNKTALIYALSQNRESIKMGDHILAYDNETHAYIIDNFKVSGFDINNISPDFKLIGFQPQLEINGAPQSVLLFNRLFCMVILTKIEHLNRKTTDIEI